jgi:DNA (cytosine-5)-methyltransferase 1
MRALDLFAGAGGLSVGLVETGFDIALAVERDRAACRTYRTCHPAVEVREGSVADVDYGALRGEIALVAGGPPCQPFSTGGLRLGHHDPRDGIPAMLLVVELAQPEAVLIENVAGLARGAKSSDLQMVLARLERLGYVPAWRVLDSADYGVPQRRTRLFIVALRDREFVFPEPTHGPRGAQPWVSAGSVLDARASIGEPNPSIVTYAKRPDSRPSPYDGHLFNGGGRPIDLARPARTILASAGGNKTHFLDTAGVVPEYHSHVRRGGAPRSGLVPGARRLTVEESALLQSFAWGTSFEGARSQRYTQVGNAVPPLLARAVAHALMSQLGRTSAQAAAEAPRAAHAIGLGRA